MSGARKALRIISIVLIVLAAVYCVAGVIAVVGAQQLAGTQVSVEGTTVDMALFASFAGWTSIISGVLTAITGFLGLHAARTRKVLAFLIFAGLGVLLNGVGVVANIVTGTPGNNTPADIVLFVLAVAAFILGIKVRKEPPTGVETLRK